MKIGIFGNTNNYPLMLAMALRRLGHNAVLVVNRKERLHRPEGKHPELAAGYPEWIMDCSELGEEAFVSASTRIGDVINFISHQSGGLILNDLGPSLLEFCPMPAVALLTGSDLTQYGDLRTLSERQQHWAEEYRLSAGGRLWTRRWQEFVARQRAGILAAAAVSAPLPGLSSHMDDLLQEIGVPESRREFLWFADVENAVTRQPRHAARLRVVNGARLNWKKPLPAAFSSMDHKGTDVLLAGFAEFVGAGGDGELVLFRKGLHIAETAALAESLGIADRIIWRDEVSLREFYDDIAGADVVCDNLGDSFPGLVALEAMALGLPVIANFQPQFMSRCYPEPVPACQATTPSDVAAHLAALAESIEAGVTIGVAGREFVRRYCSPEAAAAKCLALLQPTTTTPRTLSST